MDALVTVHTAFEQGKLDEAYDLARQMTLADSSNAEVFAWLGQICQVQLNYEEALQHYRKAVELQPDNSAYRYQVANIFMLQDNYEQAEAGYRQVYEKREINDAWLPCNLGRALLYLGKNKEAIPFLQEAIDLDDRLAEAYGAMGRALTESQRFSEAGDFYRKAIELEPNHFIYHHDLGDNCLLGGKYEAAVSSYRRAIELNPSYLWSYRNLGNALSVLERWDEAIGAFYSAAQIDSSSDEIYRDLGDALLKLEKLQEAANAFRRVIELKPHTEIAYHKLGESLGRLEQWEQAIEVYQKGIELYPHQHRLYYGLGITQERLGDIEEGIKSYKRAIELDPQQPSLVNANLANLLNNKSKPTVIKSASQTTIFIVTPSYNAVNTIDRTIASVVFQAGDFSIRYHVQDGGSSDGTVQLLERWAERIKTRSIPLLCKHVDFTYTSVKDKGMYDALFKGFNNLEIQPEDWMTWINADDILMPGAFAFIAEIDKQLGKKKVCWITGGVASVASEDVPIVNTERPLNREVIRNGLCEGQHWHYVQQEGTFFRNSLWRSVDTDNKFRKFKYAGDWNLWRLFAQTADIYQTQFPLGTFFRRAGQISQKLRKKYEAEIDATIDPELRTKRLPSLKSDGFVQLVLKTSYSSGEISISKKSIASELEVWKKKRGEASTILNEKVEESCESTALCTSNTLHQGVGYDFLLNEDFLEKNVVAFDGHWQYPAITEKHAFVKAIEFLPKSSGIVYFAFPWATLIDKLENQVVTAGDLKSALYSYRKELEAYQYIVTVCQHVLMLKYQQLFIDMGITHIYWSHAAKGQNSLPKDNRIQVFPFPLFPVQVLGQIRDKISSQRKYLFSFIGAKSNPWYLTNVRDLIIDNLVNDHRGLVIGRNNWHYQEIVYDCQIFERKQNTKDLTNAADAEQFKFALADSLFSLCPSGSGPNSIRLWESIGYGAIPVILSDTYQPPGNASLWQEAAVLCGEKLEDVLSLPNRLAEIAMDAQLIQRKQNALKQLWMLYGPDCFVYDIINLFIELQQKQMIEKHI